VIRKLKERAGTLADKIHTGRSQERIRWSLDLRLWLREEIDASSKELLALNVGAARYGEARSESDLCRGIHIPGARRPVLWPALFYWRCRNVRRDLERLKELVGGRGRDAGSAAGRWRESGFPFDRDAIAKDLGFASITRNSMDVFERSRLSRSTFCTPRI